VTQFMCWNVMTTLNTIICLNEYLIDYDLLQYIGTRNTLYDVYYNSI
jgi:hypothetical protein